MADSVIEFDERIRFVHVMSGLGCDVDCGSGQ